MNANHLMLIKLNVIATCTTVFLWLLVFFIIIAVRTRRRRIKKCHSRRKRDHFVEMKNYYSLIFCYIIFAMRWWSSVQASTLYAQIRKYDYKNFIFSTPISRALSLSHFSLNFQHSISQFSQLGSMIRAAAAEAPAKKYFDNIFIMIKFT